MPTALCAVGCLLFAASTAAAQANPNVVQFLPAAEHDLMLPSGQPVVSSYSFLVYSAGALDPYLQLDLGKPAPQSDGMIRVDFSGRVPVWPLPNMPSEARVVAKGPNGVTVSSVSNPFVYSCSLTVSNGTTSFAPGGGTSTVQVGTASSCGWSASSSASWIVVTSSATAGAGTVTYTVAANTQSTPRTGTITVAGKTITVTQDAAQSQGAAVYRISVGGGAFTDTQGRAWSADSYFSGSTSTYGVTQPINGTENDKLYQKVRYGSNFSYGLPVPNGQYTVVLHLAELYFSAARERVFDVAAEGSTLPDVDVWAEAGQFNALTKSIPVTVTDGVLNLSFTSRANYANLSGLEVLAGTASLETPVYRINIGGPAVTDGDGRAWAADQYFSGTSLTYAVAQPINGTTNDSLYQKVRYGKFSYAFPVTNGTYTVVLHFSELYFNAAGRRVFDVVAEGNSVLRTVDVWSEAGPFAALTKSVRVQVTDGVLDLSFIPLVDNANVSAIEILKSQAF